VTAASRGCADPFFFGIFWAKGDAHVYGLLP
jgi:hypothetical protein